MGMNRPYRGCSSRFEYSRPSSSQSTYFIGYLGKSGYRCWSKPVFRTPRADDHPFPRTGMRPIAGNPPLNPPVIATGSRSSWDPSRTRPRTRSRTPSRTRSWTGCLRWSDGPTGLSRHVFDPRTPVMVVRRVREISRVRPGAGTPGCRAAGRGAATPPTGAARTGPGAPPGPCSRESAATADPVPERRSGGRESGDAACRRRSG